MSAVLTTPRPAEPSEPSDPTSPPTSPAAAIATGPAPRLPGTLPLSFVLDADHEAHRPPEVAGSGRDDVRLLVSPGDGAPQHHTFAAIPQLLEPGDLLVVNTSATVPAAVDAIDDRGRSLVIHVSTELPGGLWMVEPRRPAPNGTTGPFPDAESGTVLLAGDTALQLLRRSPGSERLWLATIDHGGPVPAVLERHGRPIRYSYVPRDWPLAAYQTVFAAVPGSAEMPSAARPFTDEIVTRLVRQGIAVAPITLHTGVSSLEGHELPYPERYTVPPATATLANATRRAGGHVIAVGTTVVRALESTVDRAGTVHPGSGWTDVVVTPERGVGAVDGLLSGWHEPTATHLAMLEAVAGRDALVSAYEAAFSAGYRWHEFGDSHLMLPYA